LEEESWVSARSVAAAFVLFENDLSGGQRCSIPENYRNGRREEETGEKRTELGKGA
jgi:hypothetical protein